MVSKEDTNVAREVIHVNVIYPVLNFGLTALKLFIFGIVLDQLLGWHLRGIVMVVGPN